jgi:thiamine biosynthesis lipoprotein
MHNRSLATSGNYRKFYEKDGTRITHSIDPKSGYPQESRLLSVTILAANCMTADAYATACMVIGLEGSIQFILNRDDADGYFIYTDDSGNYRIWNSEALTKYLNALSIYSTSASFLQSLHNRN